MIYVIFTYSFYFTLYRAPVDTSPVTEGVTLFRHRLLLLLLLLLIVIKSLSFLLSQSRLLHASHSFSTAIDMQNTARAGYIDYPVLNIKTPKYFIFLSSFVWLCGHLSWYSWNRKDQIIPSLLRDCWLRDVRLTLFPVLRKFLLSICTLRAPSHGHSKVGIGKWHIFGGQGGVEMSYAHSHWRDVDVGSFCA